LSRQELDKITDEAKEFGAKGLVSISYLPEGQIKSPAKKHLAQNEIQVIAEVLEAKEGDLVLIVADEFEVAVTVLGRMRKSFAQRLDLIPEGLTNFLWITEFPLLEKNQKLGQWQAAHHPFTSPCTRHLDLLDKRGDSVKKQIRARAYDLVLNGVELASGSIRIHRRDVQEKVFDLLDICISEAKEKFGFLLDAFEYGAPPHGGIAFGLDRFVMLVVGASTIRDVIAFPKTTKGSCLLTQAPSEVAPEQLRELGLCRLKDKSSDAEIKTDERKSQ
jgi:aspartyl-tRNA synthetase